MNFNDIIVLVEEEKGYFSLARFSERNINKPNYRNDLLMEMKFALEAHENAITEISLYIKTTKLLPLPQINFHSSVHGHFHVVEFVVYPSRNYIICKIDFSRFSPNSDNYDDDYNPDLYFILNYLLNPNKLFNELITGLNSYKSKYGHCNVSFENTNARFFQLCSFYHRLVEGNVQHFDNSYLTLNKNQLNVFNEYNLSITYFNDFLTETH